MQLILKLLFVILVLSNQGCQTMSEYIPYSATHKYTEDKKQLHPLLLQGMKNQQLTEKQQQAECKELKEIYNTDQNWQTAWLLVYSLNDDFKCINLKTTIEMVESIQKTKETSPTLLWLNNNQLQLLNSLSEQQIKLNRFHKKNNQLQSKIDQVETQLQEVILKIQALKAIETSINKKIDEEFSNGQ